ncbi:uncharacterized protein LOC134837248 [Culicoides brevitarsis]|uniref:uncharacterized protein LOC134837248 n=1 Tax=Culicoides brevitarsis TaxID=469753 RepID=UPI00307C9EBE
MLPELLFTVGSSMQEFSKDDYSCILNGGCDKESTLANTETTLERIKLSKTPDLDANAENIKEDPYSWHSTHHRTDIGSNLLRSSDDPLISGGTHDNQNDTEFPSIRVISKSPSIIIPPPSPTNILTQRPKKVTRTRKKQQFKLRFHHQALPPEYLDHYEASQHSQQRREQMQQQQQLQQMSTGKKRTMETELNNRSQMTNESVKNWLQKITQLQQEGKTKVEEQDAVAAQMSQKSTKVASYKDLPYMGEMTLENSKPRRGRKPKKADICHLIYKNYGTIFPDTPKQMLKDDAETPEKSTTSKKSQNEPLNLCVRDTSDPFVVSSSDDDEEEDDEDSLMSSEQTTPLMSPTDMTMDSSLALNMKNSLQNIHSLMSNEVPPVTPSTETSISEEPSPKSGDPATFAWPSSGTFIHPMALYYQKMMDSGVKIDKNSMSPPLKASNNSETPELKQRLVPKSISKLMKEEHQSNLDATSVSSSSSNTQSSTSKSGQKRKRSAIFIPPLPAEPKSHATEVSICKFKFTGGAKPSLQEKKMLSVDSGGNFRYYSGTGDKSMRGYEFFPRESLALSSLTANTTTNAFLNATSEKIDLPPPSAGLSNDVLQIPEFPSTSVVAPLPTSPIKLHPPMTSRHHHQRFPSTSSCSTSSSSVDKRSKRKSKRSMQREKLEKTFKEKGFLIQTQQLQSAEGATYCKFRQLRKFTRYLFRSWKDHLPGDVQGQFVDANGVPHCTMTGNGPEIPSTL